MSTDQPVANNVAEVERLSTQEKKLAKQVSLGTARWVLTGAVVVYIVALFLPFMGNVSGLDLLINSQSAQDAGSKITESVFVWTSFIGLAVSTTILVITKRSTPFILAWSFTTIGLIMALLALWLRQTTEGTQSGIGIYLAILMVVIAEVTFIVVISKRDPKQAEIAEQLSQLDDTDEVGQVQRSASNNAVERMGDDNPLLVDDRRARAAERHKKQQ